MCATTHLRRTRLDERDERLVEALKLHVCEVFGVGAVLALSLLPVWRIEIDERRFRPRQSRRALRYVSLSYLVLAFFDRFAVGHPVAPRALLTDIYGRAAAGERIINGLERFCVEVEEIVYDTLLGVSKARRFIGLCRERPDIEVRWCPAVFFVQSAEFYAPFQNRNLA